MISASATDTAITFNWTNPADADFDHVQLIWGSTTGNSDDNTDTSYTTSGTITANTDYLFTVKSVDAAGNFSNGIAFTVTSSATTTAELYHFIYNASQLAAVNADSTNLSENYIVMSNIDLTGVPWTSIGNSTTAFSGIFDGNSFTISNLTISSTADYQGFFGSSGGIIKNVILDSVDISGNNRTGGLAGFSYGTIINCILDKKADTEVNIIQGSQYTGGLVGYNTGSVSDCHFYGTVTGTDSTGGLIGHIQYVVAKTISNCSVEGSVTGTTTVGGFVGRNYGTIAGSTTLATVNGYGGQAGGFVGQNYTRGNISNCNAGGSVTSNAGASIGGFAGNNGTASSANPAVITNCSASGTVTNNGTDTADYYTGGFAGSNNSYCTISLCYATGEVKNNGTGTDDYGVGGLVGINTGSIEFSHATGAVTGRIRTGGLAGGNSASGTIQRCYATGAVTGTGTVSDPGYYTGGFAGSNNGTITNCYALGETDTTGYSTGGLVGNNAGTIQYCFSAGDADNSTSTDLGGLVGANTGTVTSSYYNTSVTGLSDTGKGDGRTTTEMTAGYLTTFSAWDFMTIWNIDSSYPYLR